MTAQEARTHIRYSGWASRKVLEAAFALSLADRAKPMSVSHESIAKTLTQSILATPSGIRASLIPAIPCHLTMRFPPSISSFRNGLACRPSGKPGPTQPPTPTLPGRCPSNPASSATPAFPHGQIVMHVVNHATLHCGQIVAMLRQLGVKPPATDIVFYYYEPKTGAAS